MKILACHLKGVLSQISKLNPEPLPPPLLPPIFPSQFPSETKEGEGTGQACSLGFLDAYESAP